MRDAIGDRMHELLYRSLDLLPADLPSRSVAHLFDRRFKSADPWGYRTVEDERERIRLLVNASTRPDPKNIVEIGCAEGELTYALHERFPLAEIVGVDISIRALERARAQVPSDRVSFERTDVRRWQGPQPAVMFDLVLLCDVLYYIGSAATRKAMLHRLRSCLDPGAVVVLGHAALPAARLHSLAARDLQLKVVEDRFVAIGNGYRITVLTADGTMTQPQDSVKVV